MTSLISVAGCSQLRDIRYTIDRRITITEPQNLASVTMPTTLRWRVNDPSVLKSGGQFALLIDPATVPPPGSSLRDLPGVFCSDVDPACPNAEVLANDLHIYLTTGTQVNVPSVPFSLQAGPADAHMAVIILLDAAGRRIGDAYWRTSFKVSDRPH